MLLEPDGDVFDPHGVGLVTPFEPREIPAAFHDVDGTHSRIRDWIPVMTLVTGSVAGTMTRIFPFNIVPFWRA